MGLRATKKSAPPSNVLRFAPSPRPAAAAPPPTLPEPPADFDEAHAAKWRETVQAVAEAGREPARLLDLLRIYVVSWRAAFEARAVLAVEGPVTFTVKGGRMANPYVKIARDAEATCTRLSREIGLTGRRG